MSHPINTIIDENRQEMLAETPNDLAGDEKREYTVQEALVNLSNTLELLHELGVDERVISDVQINSTPSYRLSQRTSNFDSFIRSKDYK
jgi:hypothetical protein